MSFTPEELEEMEKADQEIEESFVLTNEEIAMAREYDKRAKYEAMTGDKQKVAAYQKAWYEANREKIAAQKKAYREANQKERERGENYGKRNGPALGTSTGYGTF